MNDKEFQNNSQKINEGSYESGEDHAYDQFSSSINETLSINNPGKINEKIENLINNLYHILRYDIYHYIFCNDIKILEEIFSLKKKLEGKPLDIVRKYLFTLYYNKASRPEILEYINKNLLELLGDYTNEYGRNMMNPLVVGFNRNKEGKIFPLFGNKIFRSERKLNGNLLMANTDSRKEVLLLASEKKYVLGHELMKSQYWHSLPKKLQDIFESGHIIVTGGNDLYQLDKNIYGNSEIFKSRNDEEYINRLDNQISINHEKIDLSENSGYLLLYYSTVSDINNGRTGILMELTDGKLNPVIININGLEYIIEIKGCGLKTGGFGGYQYRTGMNVISGGMYTNAGETEFEILEELEGEGPKVAGMIKFIRNEDMSQIIRLTPSSVRSSYTGNMCYHDITTSWQDIVVSYVNGLIDMIFSKRCRLIDRSSHPENILIYGNNLTTWTDFSDQLFIDSPQYPEMTNNQGGGFITIKAILEFIIKMSQEIPSGENSINPILIECLNKKFNEKGIELNIPNDANDDMIINTIWEKYLAYKVFNQRIKYGYFPKKLKSQFIDELDKFKKNPNNSSNDLQNMVNKSIQEFNTGLNKLLNHPNNKINKTAKEIFISLTTDISLGKFDLAFDPDRLRKIYADIFNMKFKDGNKLLGHLLNSFNEIFSFQYIFSLISSYIDSEIEMFESILKGQILNQSEKEYISSKLKLLYEKKLKLKNIMSFNMPFDQIERFLNDPNFFDEMIKGIYLD